MPNWQRQSPLWQASMARVMRAKEAELDAAVGAVDLNKRLQQRAAESWCGLA